MVVLVFIIVLLGVGSCGGQLSQRQRKLDKLQMDVDNLRDVAFDLRLYIGDIRLDIEDLQSWRNETETGIIGPRNEVVGSTLPGNIEQSLDAMTKRLLYLMNGLEAEKMTLRKIMDDMRANIQHDIDNVNESLEIMDTNINVELERHDAKFKEERNNMEKKIDAKLNQQTLTISKQLETFGQNFDEAIRQLKKANGDMMKQINSLSRLVRDEQYYISMKQDGWLQYKNYLYKLFTQLVSFDTAVKRCKEQDASLVEITDQEEFQFISDSFEHLGYFWVGATDRQTEGEWRWLSGQLVEHDNWHRGRPNNADGGEDCMIISGYLRKYFDMRCNDHWFYICKRQ